MITGMATLLLLLTRGNWMEDREDREAPVGEELFSFFFIRLSGEARQ